MMLWELLKFSAPGQQILEEETRGGEVQRPLKRESAAEADVGYDDEAKEAMTENPSSLGWMDRQLATRITFLGTEGRGMS